MKNAVIKGFLKTIIICLAVCSLLFCRYFGKYTMERTEKDMLYTLALMDYGIDYEKDLREQAEEINPLILSENTRITILDRQGNVLADTSSAIDFEDNHLGREEIQRAVEKGIGISVRYSGTEKRNMMYAAYASADGEHILRLAVPYNGFADFVKAIIPALFISVIIAFITAFFIGKRLAEGITRPLSEISSELDKIQKEEEMPKFKEYKYSELENIVNSIKILTKRIDANLEKLRYEKVKIDYILDNMREGILFIDENCNVITINKTAMEILDCKKRKTGNIIYFTHNMNIINGVGDIMKNDEDCMFDFFDEKLGKTYFVHITKVKKGILDKSMSGAIVLMMDVTSEREAQRVRQDFFSDASHELKTPITSIGGYCELLLSNMDYSDEQKREFLMRIKSSVENITGLINDILMISRLETGAECDNISQVNVKEIIENIIDTTEPMRNENNIAVNAECEDFVINADFNKIYQLINNLITNAVKYNNENGSVFIKSYIIDGCFYFSIKDTGIGIPLKDQSRVFERFYRVDKSRSRKMGGTGLGLAIVKHIVNFYNGGISLKSNAGKGTFIEIKIPLKQG